jgi:hypothetical protein
MIEQRETIQQRIASVDAALAKFRPRAAYVLLCSDGHARAAAAGQLRGLLAYIRDRDPQAQLIELCDPRAREQFIAWAIKPKGGKAN